MSVEPKVIGKGELSEEFVACVCGGSMHPEVGRQIEEYRITEWIWWRCDENPRHVSVALPIPAAADVSASAG